VGADGRVAPGAPESRSEATCSRSFRLAVPHELDDGTRPHDKKVKAGIEVVVLTRSELW